MCDPHQSARADMVRILTKPHKDLRADVRILTSPHKDLCADVRILTSPHKHLRADVRILTSPHKDHRADVRIHTSPHKDLRANVRILTSLHKDLGSGFVLGLRYGLVRTCEDPHQSAQRLWCGRAVVRPLKYRARSVRLW